VRRGASIGANATIVCGVTIGEHALSERAVVLHECLLMHWSSAIPAADWRMCKWRAAACEQS